MVYSFVVSIKPKSYNNWKLVSTKGGRYQTTLLSALKSQNPALTLMTGDLYGHVYHFFKKNEGFDADNISKPVWDCLNGTLYADDKQVKLRIAGSFDLSDANYDFTTLDFTRLSDNILIALLEGFETENHIMYIECGSFRSDMIRF